MGLKSKEINLLLIRQLKQTANEPVIAKSLWYGIAHFWKRTEPFYPAKPALPISLQYLAFMFHLYCNGLINRKIHWTLLLSAGQCRSAEKKTSLLKSEVPYFEIKTRDLTFQNTLPLKMDTYSFLIRCLPVFYEWSFRTLCVFLKKG